MNDGFGIESHGKHSPAALRRPARYLVVIDAAGAQIARLFLETREQVAEIDAATEEVAQMTQRLVPSKTALDADWDRALAGHSRAERAAAEVYTLDV